MGKPPAKVNNNHIHARRIPQIASQRNKVWRDYFHRANEDGHTLHQGRF